MLVRRSLTAIDTTICLEPVFWAAIDKLAYANKQKWTKFVRALIESKPPGQNTASFLRCYVVENL